MLDSSIDTPSTCFPRLSHYFRVDTHAELLNGATMDIRQQVQIHAHQNASLKIYSNTPAYRRHVYKRRDLCNKPTQRAQGLQKC